MCYDLLRRCGKDLAGVGWTDSWSMGSGVVSRVDMCSTRYRGGARLVKCGWSVIGGW